MLSNKPKIFIIGGSGFIGTRLTRRLSEANNYSVVIVDKNLSHTYPESTVLADVRHTSSIMSAISSKGSIINLAAEHRDNVVPASLYNEVNIEGARNVCAAAKEQGINKLVFTSSVAVYGFAELGTPESGLISPFNEYGRTKWAAEEIYKKWQSEDPHIRSLVIIRPTVVFGEGNRGNVFNLLRQIAFGKFVMVGSGLNRKSMAYVENVAAFLEYSLDFKPGVHIYNYIDKPDFTMNSLVAHVNKLLGKRSEIKFKLPFAVGLIIGYSFDFIAKITGKKFPISAIRIKKFCANSVYESSIDSTGFIPPIPLVEGIEKTVIFEFIEHQNKQQLFYSE